MPNIIEELKQMPIQSNSSFGAVDYLQNKSFYHEQVICKMAVKEDSQYFNEALSSCKDFGLNYRNYYFQSDKFTFAGEAQRYLTNDVFLRFSVLQDLQMIDEQLKRFNLRLLILSGYRHPALQKLILQQAALLKGKEFANRMFSNPDFYAPHATGGAFDIEIWDEKNNCILLTKVEGIIDRFQLEKRFNLTLAESEIRANRRLIHNLLTSGAFLPPKKKFVGHPFEYWHYGRFERLSAFFGGQNHPVFYEMIY